MTATEELRAMLDARGVEHDDAYDMTFWTGADGCAYTAVKIVPISKKPSKKLSVRRILTPAQAIEATLGRGTCHLEINTSMTAVVCDRCNYPMPRGTVLTEVRFCPNCGREVVSE